MLHLRHHHVVVDLLDAAVVAAPVRPRAHRTLGPGERVIKGRIHYSAAWLSLAAPFEPEAAKAAREGARGVDHGPSGRPGVRWLGVA
jgi:hypothetical protein